MLSLPPIATSTTDTAIDITISTANLLLLCSATCYDAATIYLYYVYHAFLSLFRTASDESLGKGGDQGRPMSPGAFQMANIVYDVISKYNQDMLNKCSDALLENTTPIGLCRLKEFNAQSSC